MSRPETVNELVEMMKARGIPADVIDDMLRIMLEREERLIVMSAPAKPLEQKRSSGAERTARWRANRNGVTSQPVTKPVTGDVTVTSQPVTPRAHVVNTSLPLEVEDIQKGSNEPQKVASALLLEPKPPSIANLKPRRHDWPADGFARFWALWPDRKARGGALTAFERVRKRDEVGFDLMMDGVRRYAANKPAERPWCNASTWLNQGRWDDDWSGTEPAAGRAVAGRGGRPTVGDNLAAAVAGFEASRGRDVDWLAGTAGEPVADRADGARDITPHRDAGGHAGAGAGAAGDRRGGEADRLLLDLIAGSDDDADQNRGVGRGAAPSADLGDSGGDFPLAPGATSRQHGFHAGTGDDHALGRAGEGWGGWSGGLDEAAAGREDAGAAGSGRAGARREDDAGFLAGAGGYVAGDDEQRPRFGAAFAAGGGGA